MNLDQKITWQKLEYVEKQKNPDWFWALGIVVIASSITSIIFKNYFFGLLLIIGGFLLGFFAVKKPDMINYEINAKGFQIKNRLFPFEKIKSFFVQKEGVPTLFVKTERIFMPILSMPIDPENFEIIEASFKNANVPEEKMAEHPSEKIMDYLGF